MKVKTEPRWLTMLFLNSGRQKQKTSRLKGGLLKVKIGKYIYMHNVETTRYFLHGRSGQISQRLLPVNVIMKNVATYVGEAETVAASFD